MKQILLLLPLIVLLAMAFASPVNAHVLQTEETIGAVLHILPDDNPTAETQTTYQLAFTDKSHTFTLQSCDCKVSFQHNGKTIDTRPLTTSSSLISTDEYTFKTAGVYHLVVDAAPKSENAFKPFSISYTVRVMTKNQTDTQPFPLTLAIGFGLIIVLLLLVAVKADGMLDNKNKL